MSRRYKKSRKGSCRTQLCSRCKTLLGKKMGANLREFRQGRYGSRRQAIAVAYSQVRQYIPACSRLKAYSRKGSRRSYR